MHYSGLVQNLDREVKKCLIEAFKKTDEAFLQKATEAKPTWKVGQAAMLPAIIVCFLWYPHTGWLHSGRYSGAGRCDILC